MILLINVTITNISHMIVYLFAFNFHNIASQQLHKSWKVARCFIFNKLFPLNFVAFHLQTEFGNYMQFANINYYFVACAPLGNIINALNGIFNNMGLLCWFSTTLMASALPFSCHPNVQAQCQWAYNWQSIFNPVLS